MCNLHIFHAFSKSIQCNRNKLLQCCSGRPLIVFDVSKCFICPGMLLSILFESYFAFILPIIKNEIVPLYAFGVPTSMLIVFSLIALDRHLKQLL